MQVGGASFGGSFLHSLSAVFVFQLAFVWLLVADFFPSCLERSGSWGRGVCKLQLPAGACFFLFLGGTGLVSLRLHSLCVRRHVDFTFSNNFWLSRAVSPNTQTHPFAPRENLWPPQCDKRNGCSSYHLFVPLSHSTLLYRSHSLGRFVATCWHIAGHNLPLLPPAISLPLATLLRACALFLIPRLSPSATNFCLFAKSHKDLCLRNYALKFEHMSSLLLAGLNNLIHFNADSLLPFCICHPTRTHVCT